MRICSNNLQNFYLYKTDHCKHLGRLGLFLCVSNLHTAQQLSMHSILFPKCILLGWGKVVSKRESTHDKKVPYAEIALYAFKNIIVFVDNYMLK